MHLGPLHRERRHGSGNSRISKGVERSVDAATYAVSFVMLAFTVHQVWLIWSTQDASGVSLVAWTAYTLGSLVWTIYGYVHGDRVIIITNFLWLLFCALILVGIVAFS